ncbi:MAG: TIGR02300 family protein [Alphaproteobacteria bacterium]
MAKAELGDKQVCPNCGAKFYDLGKRPAVCPKCANAFDPMDEAIRLKRVRTRPPAYEEEEEVKKPAAEGDDDEEAVEEEVAEADEVVAAEPLEDVTDEDEEGPANSDEIPAGFSEDVGEVEGRRSG